VSIATAVVVPVSNWLGQRPVVRVGHVPLGERAGVLEQRAVRGPDPVEVAPPDGPQLGVVDPRRPAQFDVLLPLVPGVQRPRDAQDDQFALALGQLSRLP
jgi:hypothetical protein